MDGGMKTLSCLLLTASLTTAQISMAAESAVAAPADKAATAIRHADPAQAQKLIKDEQVVILDLRTPKEFKAGHLAGAKNIDFTEEDFEANLAKLDKGKTYLIHCATGNRSARSLPAFKKLQFKSVVHLDGGIQAWEKAGKPVEK